MYYYRHIFTEVILITMLLNHWLYLKRERDDSIGCSERVPLNEVKKGSIRNMQPCNLCLRIAKKLDECIPSTMFRWGIAKMEGQRNFNGFINPRYSFAENIQHGI